MNGPFLYDDDPAPLHTGTPRRSGKLLVAIFGGTIVVGVLMVLLMPLIKGSPEEQVREAVTVFVGALEKGDLETAYGLLCEDERARMSAPDDVRLGLGRDRRGGRDRWRAPLRGAGPLVRRRRQ